MHLEGWGTWGWKSDFLPTVLEDMGWEAHDVGLAFLMVWRGDLG